MNCQHIADILDDGNVARLDLAQRRDVEAHLAGCADCAQDWRLHGAFAALPDLPLPAGLAGRCRAFVVAAARSGSSRRARGGLVLGGMLVAVAAAAALLLFPRQAAIPLVTAELQPRTAGEGQQAQAPPPGQPEGDARLTEAVLPAAAGSLFTVRVVAPLLDGDERSGLDDVYPPEMRAQYDGITRAPARLRTLEALRTALLAELRTVPGITVVNADAPVLADAAARQFQVTLGISVGSTPSGQLIIPEDRYTDAGVSAQKLLATGKSEFAGFADARIDLQATCNGVDPCADVAGAATSIVQQLVKSVFPVSNPLPVAARSAPPDARIQALIESFSNRYNNDPADLRDPALVREVLALAATADAARRAQLWRLMRGVGSQELVQPLLASAVQDSDDARLQAVATLAADFPGDPRVQETLETVARTDPRTLVRAVARRGLQGEDAWQQYVVSTLKDSGMSPAERLEAVVYHLQPPAVKTRDYDMNLSAFEDLDEDGIRTLARLMPDATAAFPGGEGQAGTLLSNLGYRHSKESAVVDTLLHYLENGKSARTRMIAGEVLARTRATELRVREALRKCLATDPDPKVRDWVRQVMGDDAPPATP